MLGNSQGFELGNNRVVTEKDLNKQGLKRKTRVVEKVEFRGNFRIVGLVYNGSKKMGFAIIDVKNYNLKLFTQLQTIGLLQRYKFENAELHGKDIVNTECSMDRLLKFNTRKQVIGNRGITILGEIIKEGNMLGYRAMNELGRVVDISEVDLIKVAERTDAGLINAKIVPKGCKKHVSAIKGDFKRIEKKEFEKMVEDFKGKSSEQVAKEHKNYLDKQVNRYLTRLISAGGIRVTNTKTCKRNIKIIFKEFLFKEFPELAECTKSSIEEILTAGLAMYIEKHRVSGYSTNSKNTVVRLKYSHLGRVKYKIIGDELLDVVRYVRGEGDAYTFLVERNKLLNYEAYQVDINLFTEGTLKTMAESLVNEAAINQIKAKKRSKRAPYNTGGIEYTDVKGIAAFGYTINKDYIGRVYNSPIYGNRPLRWLFEGLGLGEGEEEFLLDNINCFGDIELLRKIDNNLGKGDELTSKYAECLLFIIALYNLDVAKFIKRKYVYLNESTLDLDKVNQEKFVLNDNDKVYYLSGGKFNKVTELRFNERWTGLSEIPEGLLTAMSLYLDIDEHMETFLYRPWLLKRY